MARRILSIRTRVHHNTQLDHHICRKTVWLTCSKVPRRHQVYRISAAGTNAEWCCTELSRKLEWPPCRIQASGKVSLGSGKPHRQHVHRGLAFYPESWLRLILVHKVYLNRQLSSPLYLHADLPQMRRATGPESRAANALTIPQNAISACGQAIY